MKNTFTFIFKYFPHLPKSLFFCLRTLPFSQAIKIPIVLNCRTKVASVRKGVIKLDCNVHPGVIFIGFGSVGGVTTPRRSYLRFGVGENSAIVFKGPAIFAKGVSLSVDCGKVVFGSQFSANDNFCLSCNDSIKFGNNVMIGWEVKFLDSDNHRIISDNCEKPNKKPIYIGDNVWIASYVDVLKGSTIGNGSVVAYRALVASSFPDGNQIIGGAPARVLSNNIEWHPK